MQTDFSLEALRQSASTPYELDVSTEGFFSRLFGRIGDSLRFSLQSIRGFTDVEAIADDKSRLLGVLKDADYLDLGALKVNVPEGLQVDYLTFTNIVEQCVEYVDGVRDQVITPFKQYLASVISNPQAKYLPPTKLLEAIDKHEATRLSLINQLKACFNNTHAKTIPYEQAISRNADWDVVLEKATRLSRAFNFDRKALASDVEDLQALLDTLYNRFEHDVEFKKLNPKLTNVIFRYTTIAADSVAFYAVSFYHLQSLTQNLNFTIKFLIKTLR